jgi:hypothetical protein
MSTEDQGINRELGDKSTTARSFGKEWLENLTKSGAGSKGSFQSERLVSSAQGLEMVPDSLSPLKPFSGKFELSRSGIRLITNPQCQ